MTSVSLSGSGKRLWHRIWNLAHLSAGNGVAGHCLLTAACHAGRGASTALSSLKKAEPHAAATQERLCPVRCASHSRQRQAGGALAQLHPICYAIHALLKGGSFSSCSALGHQQQAAAHAHSDGLHLCRATRHSATMCCLLSTLDHFQSMSKCDCGLSCFCSCSCSCRWSKC